MSERDAYLVGRCLAGDTDAFGELVDVYQGAVYATAYYYAGRFGAAEDITQEAFFAGYRSLRHLKNPAKFGPWLKEVTCRTAANWLRRNAKRLGKETPLPQRRSVPLVAVGPTPLGRLEREERFERIQQAIDALPERYRLPVVLRYLQELSYEEISHFTGETPTEIRGVLQRAGTRLRELLADFGGDATGDVRSGIM